MTSLRQPTDSSWPVVRSLARFQGKKLISSPSFLAGVGLATLGSAVFVRIAVTDTSASWTGDGWTVHAGFLILAIFTMLAVNSAALRDRRSHTVEQHEALPVGKPTRSTGLISATAWPAALSSSFLAIVVSFAALKFGVQIAHTAVQLIHNGLLVMMLGALGLALAAWLPSAFVAPVAAFALYTIHPGDVPVAWQTIWPFADINITSLAGWHVLYLAGLTLVLTAIAQIRWGLGRRQVVTLLAGSLMVFVSLSVVISEACSSRGACSF